MLSPLLNYTIGCPSWINTAPIPVSDASVSMTNTLEKSGKDNTGVDVIASFNLSNASWAAWFQEKDLLCNKLVKGFAMMP
jgi:hypothetical protein